MTSHRRLSRAAALALDDDGDGPRPFEDGDDELMAGSSHHTVSDMRDAVWALEGDALAALVDGIDEAMSERPVRDRLHDRELGSHPREIPHLRRKLAARRRAGLVGPKQIKPTR